MPSGSASVQYSVASDKTFRYRRVRLYIVPELPSTGFRAAFLGMRMRTKLLLSSEVMVYTALMMSPTLIFSPPDSFLPPMKYSLVMLIPLPAGFISSNGRVAVALNTSTFVWRVASFPLSTHSRARI